MGPPITHKASNLSRDGGFSSEEKLNISKSCPSD